MLRKRFEWNVVILYGVVGLELDGMEVSMVVLVMPN